LKGLGEHVLLELFDCDAEILNSKEKVGYILRRAADVAQAHVVGDFFHEFSPHGISGILVISESHFSIHTWPEYNYAAVDLFSCGDSLNMKGAVDYLKEGLKSKKTTILEIKRGVLDLPPEEITHKPKAITKVRRLEEAGKV